MTKQHPDHELSRIQDYYAERAADPTRRAVDTLFNPGTLFAVQGRERALLQTLARAGLADLRQRRILDVGCGIGGELRAFLRYGARPENLSGVDLLPERVEEARRLAPTLDLRVANAESLPFDDASFDLVTQFMMLSSIQDEPMRRRVCAEMRRVARPGGLILSYDFWINPRNPATRPLTLADLRRLFPDCALTARRVTLAPPLARLVAPRSWLLAALLESLPPLRTHDLAALRVPPANARPSV